MPRYKKTRKAIFFVLLILPHLLFFVETKAQELIPNASLNNVEWKYKYEKTPAKIASDNESVILFFQDGKIELINLKDGQKNWQSSYSGEIFSDIIFRGESIYFLAKGFKSVNLIALNKSTGIANWVKEIGIEIEKDLLPKYYLIPHRNTLIISTESKVLSLDYESGKLNKLKDLTKIISTKPIIRDNILIFGTENKSIVYFSVLTNEIIKEFYSKNISKSISLLSGSWIVSTNENGYLSVLDLNAENVIWNRRLGARVSNILSVDDKLLMSSLDNFLYAFHKLSGNQIWKKRFEGKLVFEPLVIENFVFVSSLYSENLEVIDLVNGKLEKKINLGNGNYLTNQHFRLKEYLILPTANAIYCLYFPNAK